MLIHKIKHYAINFIFLLTSLLLVVALPTEEMFAAKKNTTTSKSASKKKKTSTSKSKSKSRSKTPPPASPTTHTFVKDTLLADGINYKQLYVNVNKVTHLVNIIQIDMGNSKVAYEVMKAGNNNTELETLPNLISNMKVDVSKKNIVGGINANFWMAGTNYPNGPTIVDGEVVEMQLFRDWSSIFFNESGTPFIGRFFINGEFISKTGNRFSINVTNHRKTENGIVLYNRFGGDVIPYINNKKTQELMMKAMDNSLQETSFDDSTEISGAAAVERYKSELIAAERSANIEYSLQKICVSYLEKPAVNTFIRCRVDSIIMSGSVNMPQNGFIISVGVDANTELLPKVGDTISLHYWTNYKETEIFQQAVCGTPRLVRDGVARHEYSEENGGYRKRNSRFESHALPRTAIGYDRNNTKLFLVAVNGTSKEKGCVGANLSQLAEIMEHIGCYSAMNLDGGGSTNMLVGEKNVINPGASRKLSVGIAAISLKQPKVVPKLPHTQKKK